MSTLIANRDSVLSFKIPTSDFSQLSSWCVSITPSYMNQTQISRCTTLYNLATEAHSRNDIPGAQRIVSEYLKVSERFASTAPITVMPLSIDRYQVKYRDLENEIPSRPLFVEMSDDGNAIFRAPCQVGEYQMSFVAFGKPLNIKPTIWKVIEGVNLTAGQVFEVDFSIAACSRV